MESQDYSFQQNAQKEKDDREIYENAKAEMNEAFENVISQALEDGISTEDIMQGLKNALMDCIDGRVFNIEEVML